MGQITNGITTLRRRGALPTRRDARSEPAQRLWVLGREGGDAAVGVDRDLELVEEVPTEETVHGCLLDVVRDDEKLADLRATDLEGVERRRRAVPLGDAVCTLGVVGHALLVHPAIDLGVGGCGGNQDQERQDERWHQDHWAHHTAPGNENGTTAVGDEIDAVDRPAERVTTPSFLLPSWRRSRRPLSPR